MIKKFYQLSTGDEVFWHKKLQSIYIPFKEKRKVLSTSLLNGAYSEDLVMIFNHNCGDEDGGHCKLKAKTYLEHLAVLSEELGFCATKVTGMGTAAKMENCVVVEKTYADLTVTAIVTGGVEGNGGRAGDPATYYAPQEKLAEHKAGTINIMLSLDADVPEGVLTRALVTCTEAKTAALQELMAGSLYSTGLATGSGTDQTIIFANPKSNLYFEGAGKHSKLGELIGVAVKDAVKKALNKQSGLSPKLQYDLLRRWKRYGVSQEKIYELYQRQTENSSKADFQKNFTIFMENNKLIASASVYIHLLDQLAWGLLPIEDVQQETRKILEKMAQNFEISLPKYQYETSEDLVWAWWIIYLNCYMKGDNDEKNCGVR